MFISVARQLIVAILLLLGAASMATAQGSPFPAPPTGGWDPATDGQRYASPDEACRAQWLYFNAAATYEAPSARDAWHSYDCHWTGNGIQASIVVFRCPPGWMRIAPGQCIVEIEQRASVSCDCNGPVSETPTPMVGNPINLQSGDKIEFAQDYATADGLFSVDRFYHSGYRGRASESPSETAGFGRRFHGLLPGHVTVGGSNFTYIEYLPVAGGMETFSATDGSNTSSFTYAAQAPSRYRAAMVTTPSSTRAAFFQANQDTSSTGELRLDFPNGDYLFFRRAGSGATAAGAQRLMIPTEHRLASGYTRYFDYSGTETRPYRIRDSFGRQMQLTWQNVSWEIPCYGGSGWCSGIEMNAQPVITNIALPDGTSLAYTYNAARRATGGGARDRLVSVERKSSTGAVLHARTYLYEDADYPYAMTGMLDQNGARLATYAYDAAGLPASTELAGGVNRYEVEHLRVDESNLRRVVTNPLGLESTYSFQRTWFNDTSYLKPRSLIGMDIAASANVPAQTNSFTYSDDLLTQRTDGRSIVFQRTNDADGRPTQIRDAHGRPEAQITNITWHATWDLPLTETRGNLRVEYDYDTQARIIARREVDISTHTVPYSTNGETRQWSYTYSSDGRLLTSNGPRPVDGLGNDDIETYAYDTAGNLTSITNGLGHVTRFESFDGNGRPKRMYDANNVQTRFTYDQQGRMTEMSVREPGGTGHAVTTFEYDIEHRIVGITRPATARLGITYDLAGRLTHITSPSGETIAFTHDAMGNVTRQRVTDAAANQRSDIQRTFDELGRMLTESYAVGRTASYAYDAQGNATRLTSPRNFATDQTFDGLARLVQLVHPDTGSEASAYSTNDDLTSFTDPLSVATTFNYNGFGQVIREVSPDRGTSVFIYNAGGDLTAATDGRGQRVDMTYDILGRLLTRTPLGLSGEQVSYAYDTASITDSYSVGRLATITDASGTTKFKYDHRGNVIVREQVIAGSPTLTLAMTYDLADRVSRITYPSGRWVDYARDTRGRVETITTLEAGGSTPTSLMASMTYEPFGALASATMGNGHLYKQSRDDSGRLTARRYRTGAGTAIWSVTYAHDLDDNITGITDLVDASRSLIYHYDSVDRLSRVDMATGSTRREDYVHDVGGNRIRVERRAAITDVSPTSQDTYTRTSGTNRIASIATPAGTRGYTHDARGNRTAEDRPGTNDVTVGYDGYARLTSYVRVGDANLAMAYNGMDQRVALTSGGTTHRFVYDMDGRLLGEYGANGSQYFAEYVWQVPEVSDGTQSFGGDDGMGGWAPLAVVASDGAGGSSALHWLHVSHLGVPVGSYDASGNATSLTGITLLGFPGQTQTLADLYYNQYRDYDPTTGRYLQADPIGLAGDVNPYVYAEADPVGMIDPSGLQRRGRGSGPPRAPVLRTPRPRPGTPEHRSQAGTEYIARVRQADANGQCFVGPRPPGVGIRWIREPSDRGNGIRYTNPENGDQIRFMPGNPNNRWPNSRVPYVRWTRGSDGANLDINGRPLPDARRPEAHIPQSEWFRSGPR